MTFSTVINNVNSKQINSTEAPGILQYLYQLHKNITMILVFIYDRLRFHSKVAAWLSGSSDTLVTGVRIPDDPQWQGSSGRPPLGNCYSDPRGPTMAGFEWSTATMVTVIQIPDDPQWPRFHRDATLNS